jgi:hypothetical protein
VTPLSFYRPLGCSAYCYELPRENSKNILKNKKLLGLNPQLRDEFRGIVTVDFRNASPSALLFTVWEFSCSRCAISHRMALIPSLQRYFVALQRLPNTAHRCRARSRCDNIPTFAARAAAVAQDRSRRTQAQSSLRCSPGGSGSLG